LIASGRVPNTTMMRRMARQPNAAGIERSGMLCPRAAAGRPTGTGGDVRVGVVGAGILGLAVARRLLHDNPGLDVTVLDKESRVAAHQTGRNSGVVHAGLYYTPGSLKARLCTRGVTLLRSFCAERGIPYEECGKLVVALDEAEAERLQAIHGRGVANGVPGLRMVDASGIRAIEPHAVGMAALHSPRTAIVSFLAVAGVQIRLGEEVVTIAATGASVRVQTTRRDHEFDRLIACAGLHADRVARLAGDDRDPAIVPFRGDYHLLRPSARDMVRGLIYPVPDPRYPFLGIHLTRRIDGEVLVGPNAVLAFAREGYTPGTVGWQDLREIVGWPGFRRLARRHWRTGARELYLTLSRSAFVREARRYVPALRTADVVPGPAGVRAQAVDAAGALVDDFRISRRGPIVNVRNAPSPAATSALAIAEHISREVGALH
jgi:L-2-hydroxyglutarate oxidase LhgO